MKTKSLLLVLILMICVTAFSQEHKHHQQCKRDKIKSQKVAFITEKLSLTVEEAQKFWPVYNDFHDKKDDLNKEQRKIIDNYELNKEKLSDSEIKTIYLSLTELDNKEWKLLIEYRKSLLTVLPLSKAMELQLVEKQFKRELLGKMKQGGGVQNCPEVAPE